MRTPGSRFQYASCRGFARISLRPDEDEAGLRGKGRLEGPDDVAAPRGGLTRVVAAKALTGRLSLRIHS
jgi:hypothetical protein